MSLFGLGTAFIATARKFVYNATHPPSGAPAGYLASTSEYLFLTTTGPDHLWPAYFRSMSLLVSSRMQKGPRSMGGKGQACRIMRNPRTALHITPLAACQPQHAVLHFSGTRQPTASG